MGILLQSLLLSIPPFRLNKYKRYENHGVSGFPIKCNFSLDGKTLASGSSDGSVYLYDYHSTKVVKKIKAYNQACIDVAFHPVIPNVIASCSWDGSILVLVTNTYNHGSSPKYEFIKEGICGGKLSCSDVNPLLPIRRDGGGAKAKQPLNKT
ncbi:hypothetical protein RJT34_30264 [Clitoria ternatea]|uniref:Anaphase-promoting complex subunit 4-like WD40 domain-containing protein n=1 Tax=Clitoria ternatea TaxID=43366 RepID=A0AAN9I084_CLITE